MAEINVPACPMPIHQTKLTIAKPQATGMLTPQIPTPRIKSQAIARCRTPTNENASNRPTHQSRGV